MLNIEQNKTIIRLCVLDFFDTLGLPRPHEVQIEQLAEKIIRNWGSAMKEKTIRKNIIQTKNLELSAFVHVTELKPCDCDFNGQNPVLICKTKKPSKYCRPIKNVVYYKHANKIWGQGEISK